MGLWDCKTDKHFFYSIDIFAHQIRCPNTFWVGFAACYKVVCNQTKQYASPKTLIDVVHRMAFYHHFSSCIPFFIQPALCVNCQEKHNIMSWESMFIIMCFLLLHSICALRSTNVWWLYKTIFCLSSSWTFYWQHTKHFDPWQ